MKNLAKKILAVLLTLCVLMSCIITASATDASDPAYKMLFDKGEIFRTTTISTSQEVTISFDYYLADGGVTVEDTYVSGYSTTLKSGAVSSFSLTVPNSVQNHSFMLTAKTATAELYIWNVKIAKSDSTEVAFENRTDRTTCEFTEITYADLPELVEKNFVLLVDTTSLADDGEDNKSFWFNNLGMSSYGDLPNGTYTVQFDVCPVTLAQSGSKFHFRTGNGSGASSDAGFWKPELTVGEWTTTSSTFTVTDDTTTGNHILFVYGGFKGYVDNLVILDSDGNEVAGTYTDMGGLSIPSDYADYLTLDYFVVEDEPEVELSDDYAIYQDSSATTSNYDTYFHTYDYSTYNDAAKEVPVGEYTVTLNVYAQSIGTIAYKPITGSWANAGEQLYWTPTEDDLNKWVTVTYTGTTTDIAKLHTLIYVAGFKGYVDDITVYSGDTELYTLGFTESDNGKAGHDTSGAGVVTALPKAIADAKPTNEPAPTGDYVVLVDNSANTGFGQFYLHELGMAHDATYPIGDYTIKFDYYPIANGSSKNIVAHLTATGWSGDAFPGTSGQKWLEVTETLGEWQTISFDITTIAEGQFPWFYIGAGMKGYFDNYQIIDKSTGETVLDFTPIADDLGKTSKEIATVVEFEEVHIHTAGDAVRENIVDATCKDAGTYDEVVYCTECNEEISRNIVTNDFLLVDTTTVDNGTPNNFWFNTLEMSGYGTLPNGTYTIQFDVCPITLPTGGNLFHYRTGSGSGPSSDAGWWKPDLAIGEWTTTSNTFTVKDDTTTGNHIFYVYGGFKGYVDNFVILDSNGNKVAGTYTGISGLSVPEQHTTYLTITNKYEHTAGETVCENVVDATCKAEGSYYDVVYCTVCNTELSRNKVTVDALAHTPSKDNGEIVYAMTETGHAKVCDVCSEEFEFEAHTGDLIPNGATGHIGECTVCGLELSEAVPHNFGTDNVCDDCDWTCINHSFVKGDTINPGNCTTDKVIATYCSICGIAGENDVTTAPGHTEGEVQIENRVPAGCEDPGSHDEVVYCSVCGEELSRNNVPDAAAGHTPGSTWEENHVYDCIEGNSYEVVTNCAVCFEEISRVEHTDEPTGHDIYDYDAEPSTCSWEGWIAHSQCVNCQEHFAYGTTDKFSTDYISSEDVYIEIDKDAHKWVEVEDIEPDYDNSGKIGYKYCEYCDKFVYGDKELDLVIDYDALYDKIDPILSDTYDELWAEFTDENPEPDEDASEEEWNEYYDAFNELWIPVYESIYNAAYIEALEAAATAEGVEFEIAVLEKEEDDKDDKEDTKDDAGDKKDESTNVSDNKTENNTEDKVDDKTDGDKSETSPVTGETLATVAAALTAVITAGFVLISKARKA